MVESGGSAGDAETPQMPEGLLDELKKVLSEEEAPFLRHLGKHLTLEWLATDESRLGMTRFEYDPNELFRRRRLRVAPGSVTIGLNRVLVDDELLFRHTLVHELLHAAGMVEHGGNHAELVKRIAPAPSLADSVVLRRLRQDVLDSLPERQWICGNCGHAWERVRVSAPTRCPKCARPFSTN
ncbi:MAG: hypothetical protein VX402_03220 [Candidatus Thermoplasmatota archaeon]|nr:hypothetical protein [Candidatus Thermoplasmatota archaeon]MEE2606814.1 hypothetical protein [Candidatus Thermoplasmatota archaeon]MEE3276999.1 hypothetical protein [Candidatus Thermoplasmatota archaeon]